MEKNRMHVNCLRTFIVSLATILLLAGTTVASDQKTPDSPVAIVNGVPISRDSFNRQFKEYRQGKATSSCQGMHLSSDGIADQQPTSPGACQPENPDRLAALQSDFLEIMINNELLFQESQHQNIDIPEIEIDAYLYDLKCSYDNDADFYKDLDLMHLSEQDLKKEIHHHLAGRKLVYEKIEKNIIVTPEEAKKYYEDNRSSFTEPEQVRVSHILVAVPTGAPETYKAEARLKIEQIRDRIKSGEDFAAVAKQTSECPSSENGGDLGFISRGQTNDAPFEDTIFTCKPNEINIIWTHFGYDLLRVTDHKDKKDYSFEEVREEVNRQIVESKKKGIMETYINNLRSAAKIEKLS
jgi:peptidyl-prolyl cis-trans isomerase C